MVRTYPEQFLLARRDVARTGLGGASRMFSSLELVPLVNADYRTSIVVLLPSPPQSSTPGTLRLDTVNITRH